MYMIWFCLTIRFIPNQPKPAQPDLTGPSKNQENCHNFCDHKISYVCSEEFDFSLLSI